MTKNSYDFPVYLYNEGTNYEAYKFFMPAQVQKEGKRAWRFRVWAPNALAISVVGDFNGWDETKDRMEPLGNTGIWECCVSGAKRYDNYRFAVRGADERVVYKSDPYATHAETAPATASKLFPLSGFEWHDQKYLEERAKKDSYSCPINIYEVHLGSWKLYPDGNYYSYKKLADELVPYVKQMGYTHLELLPVTEHPFDGSWGYQSTGLFAPTSRYGTPHDFMYFVDKCHEEGIGIIMDFVLSHFPKDSYGLYEFDGTCLYEYGDVYKQEHKGWGTRVYDYNKPQVRSYLISAVDFWLSTYHIDGMRMDAVASMLYLNYDRREGEWLPNEYGGEFNLEAIYFLQTMNKAVLSRHPDVLMIAEESTAFPMVTMPPDIGGLGFNYKWNMGWMNDTLDYVRTDPLYRKGCHDKLTFSITYAFSENYILPFSHDEVVHGKASLIGKVPGTYEEKFGGLKTLLSYQIAHPGKKLNFMGNEFGQFIEWDYKRPLDWFLLDYDSHYRLREYVKDLNAYYLSSPPLYELDNTYNGFKWIVVDDRDQNVIAFSRFDKEGKEVIGVFNFSPVERWDYRIGVNKWGVYGEDLNSEAKKYGGTTPDGVLHKTIDESRHGKEQSVSLDLKGYSAVFLTLRKEGKKPVKKKTATKNKKDQTTEENGDKTSSADKIKNNIVRREANVKY
ncbi:MAG: 1,4-alpha-glucan branching protein GlgB [Clostridia bacterium]|nr:1,4-alpha-glucan branching protein GlgB [Clostridia bacterium]